MSRRETRENAMKFIFQTLFQREDFEEQVQVYCEEHKFSDEAESIYFLDVVRGVAAHAAEIDESIAKCAKGWTISRMPKVDLAIMRLSTYEMIYRTDIPASISINEAVELAKKFGDDGTKAFINGVLGKVFTEISQGSEKIDEGNMDCN